MKTVTTTSVFPPCWDPEDILLRLHKSSFTCLDLAFDYCIQNKDYPFMTDAYELWVTNLKEKAQSLGITFTHGHAPFSAGARGVLVEKTFHCASLLGIRYLVVHPQYKNKDGQNYEKEEFLEVNKEAILPLLTYAEKYNVVILTENLLWGASIRFAVISELVERVNSPYFGWCYDIGHGHSQGEPLEALLDCRIPPLSLHIHDNHGNGRDEHLIPGDGTLDFEKCFSYLKRIGYAGDFVLEAHHQAVEAEDKDRDAILERLYTQSQLLKEKHFGAV